MFSTTFFSVIFIQEDGLSCKSHLIPASLERPWRSRVASDSHLNVTSWVCTKMALKLSDKMASTHISTWPTWPSRTKECILVGRPGTQTGVRTLSFQLPLQFKSQVSLYTGFHIRRWNISYSLSREDEISYLSVQYVATAKLFTACNSEDHKLTGFILDKSSSIKRSFVVVSCLYFENPLALQPHIVISYLHWLLSKQPFSLV